MVEAVQKIQNLRKFSLVQALQIDRVQIVTDLIRELQDMANSPQLHALAKAYQLAPEIVSRWEFMGSAKMAEQHLLAFQERRTAEVFPTGVLALLTEHIFPIRATLERWVPAFLAGNVTLLAWPERQGPSRDLLIQIFTQAQVPPESYQWADTPIKDLAGLVSEHPSVAGVSVVSSLEQLETFPTPKWQQRKFQMWLTGFTTNLILDEPGLRTATEQLGLDMKSGFWRTPFFPQRWIVLDSLEKTAEALLNEILPAPNAGAEDFLKLAESEEGKIQNGWVKHLPLCSVIHQSEIRKPTITLNSVKYPFDMQKWVNHSTVGFAVQIWGDETKSQKLIEKLEVGQILINQPFPANQSLLIGAKGCLLGTTDLRFDGHFFSEPRRVKKPAQL